MAAKVKVTKQDLVENMRAELETVGTRYARNKATESELNKSNKEDNARIKELFELINIDECEVNGYILNKCVAITESYDEAELIKFIKNNLGAKDVKKVVKTKAYVDMDALKEVIDKGLICNNDIAPYKTSKPTVKILVKQKKV